MYRITQLTGHEIYRIERLRPWLFHHWGRPVWTLVKECRAGGDTCYWVVGEYSTLAKAQDRVAELQAVDKERLARSLGLWRVIWP